MAGKLEGKNVAILVTDGFEQVELSSPKEALEREGASCTIVAPKEGRVRGWDHVAWGSEITVDRPLSLAGVDDFDALLLPGGVMNPDNLRVLPEARAFVRDFFASGRPVAAICHAPWMLIDAGVVEGRRLTSWPSLRTDLENAGAEWVDEPVVVEDALVTSRKPGDLEAFNEAMCAEFALGRRTEARRAQVIARVSGPSPTGPR